MAWSVVVFALPSRYRWIDDLPADFKPEPLGSKAHVLSVLVHMYPDASFADSDLGSYGLLRRHDFSIEFTLHGDAAAVDAIGLRIHGADSVLDAIQNLCEHTGWRAYDTSTGDLIDFQRDPAEGLRGWRNFAGKVIGHDRNPNGYHINSYAPDLPKHDE